MGSALLSRGKSIVGQMVAFGEESIEDAFRLRIEEAVLMRRKLFCPAKTNAFRLINMEGDGLAGLIVDAYKDVLVIQISTPGMAKWKELSRGSFSKLFLLEPSLKNRHPLFESGKALQRKKDISMVTQTRSRGFENGLLFSVHVLEGQKTGLFLDQREMRSQIRELSQGKKSAQLLFLYRRLFSCSISRRRFACRQRRHQRQVWSSSSTI